MPSVELRKKKKENISALVELTDLGENMEE